MRTKDHLNFLFESIFNRTFSITQRKLTKLDYLRQINRHNSNIEISTLKYLFDRYQFDLVVDVGANKGQFYNFIRRKINYKGLILGIEPSKNDFHILENLSQLDSNFKVLNMACGSEVGSARLNISKDTTMSSFYEIEDYSMRRFPNISYIESEEVKVETLAHILSNQSYLNSSSKIYLKVDTQGHDLQVVKGLGNWSKNIIGMQSEMSLIPIYKNIPFYYDVLKYYQSQNFNLLSSIPVTRDKKDSTIIEFNGFFVKRDAN